MAKKHSFHIYRVNLLVIFCIYNFFKKKLKNMMVGAAGISYEYYCNFSAIVQRAHTKFMRIGN